jgi:hypothetical protein
MHPEGVRLDELGQRLQRVQESLETVEGSSSGDASDKVSSRHAVCVICMEDEATHAMVPCGHECVCAEDAKSFQGREATRAVRGSVCPVCRAHVTNIIRVFT